MQKFIVGAALCVATIAGLGAAPATAGEITRKGETPMVIGTIVVDGETHTLLNAQSACAFSGLNDEFVLGDESADRVQNWGHIPGHAGGGRFGPGTACRGGAPVSE